MNADKYSTTFSGFDFGSNMAMLMHTIYSDKIRGVGLANGGLWYTKKPYTIDPTGGEYYTIDEAV